MKNRLKIKTAVIPAAGAGSRMGYLGSILPKCMYPLADKPIIHRVVENARLLGVEEFVVITHFKEAIIRDYFKVVLIPRLNIRVRFVHQNKLSGLADAIALASPFIHEPFAVILGDDFTLATDFDNLLESLHLHPEAVVVEGIVEETDRRRLTSTCCVKRDQSGRIRRIAEKPTKPFSTCRGTGFYLFRPEVFTYIRNTPVTAIRHEREITETIRLLAGKGRAFAEFIRGINMNINSFDDLLSAWNTFARVQPFLDTLHARNNLA